MGTPNAVKKAGAEADKLMSTLAEGKPLEIVKEDLETENKDESQKPEDAGAGPEVKPDEKIQPSNDKPEEQNAEYWKHKYEVLHGMVDQQKADYQTNLSEVKRQLVTANQTIDSLNEIMVKKETDKGASPDTGKKKPVDDQDAPTHHLDVEDFTGYGSEMVEFVNGFNALLDQNKKLMDLNNELRGRVDDVGGEVKSIGEDVRTNKATDFFTELTKLVPEWREINPDNEAERSQDWLIWLGQNDPFSGERRQDLLEKAHNALDVKRVAHFFKSFINETNWQSGSSKTPVASGEENLGEEKTNDTLPSPDSEIVPDQTTGSSGTIKNDAFEVVTRAKYAEAANKRAAGKMPEKEFAKITKNFQRSIAEGKV